MKAVHFGGGSIGRGCVAEFLHESGYEVVFADVIDSIVEDLQKIKSYKVTEAGGEGDEHVKVIDNYRAINSKYHVDDVVKEISTADVVTCAVGPNILKSIAPPIALGIDARTEKKPLAIIACENSIGATDTLAGYIKDPKNTPPGRLATIDDRARFANCTIDRIVPTQPPDYGPNIKTESFYEWCVDQTPFESAGGHPPIKAIHWVEDLHLYTERKLFTVNTGHATAAYYGHNAGKRTIHDALMDPYIKERVHEALEETSHLVRHRHSISEEEQAAYVDTIITRISNPLLEDLVDRVGRAPLRKLSRKERFIGPASQLAELGDKYDALVGGVEMALKFQNIPGDEESVELAKILAEKSADEAAEQITGLEKSHPLYPKIVETIKKVQAEMK